MSDIMQVSGNIFFTKGNDVVPISMNKSLLSGNEESPNVQQAKKLIADGYSLAINDGSDLSKQQFSLIDKITRGQPQMNIDPTDGLGSKILNTVSKLGGKIPGVLGILDILGMKGEYDQIMAGEHPILNQVIDTENKPLTYKDGGYVTNPFVKDIFDN
jgi:hypothetical protein|tara:strand:- start:58 stop:531 length:474 start_codon:yes stop_codon:yes gene_type:complete